MARWFVIAALIAGLAAGCGNKKKQEAAPQSFPEGSAEAAFVAMHRAFRAADGDAAWALFSTEMRQAMATRMKSLREQPERLKQEVGEVPDELATMSDEAMYRLLLRGDKMQKKLAAGFPQVADTEEKEPGLREIRYRDPRRGACTQLFVKEDGAWKAQRGPSCPGAPRE